MIKRIRIERWGVRYLKVWKHKHRGRWDVGMGGAYLTPKKKAK